MPKYDKFNEMNGFLEKYNLNSTPEETDKLKMSYLLSKFSL